MWICRGWITWFSQRVSVCEKLAVLDVRLDEKKNVGHRGMGDLTAPDSKVRVLVIPTNEELGIARRTYEYVRPMA